MMNAPAGPLLAAREGGYFVFFCPGCRYLSDCTHPLAGQTVPMEPI